MKRMTFACTLMLTLSHLTGCGEADRSLLKNAPVKPLIIVLGGNGSCDVVNPSPYNMPMTQKFKALKARIDAGISGSTDYVIACYSAAEDGVYSASSVDEGRVYRRTPEQLVAHLNKNFPDNYPVALMGYSYGGWLALQTAIHYDNTNFGLYSIDPISRRYCPTSQNGCVEFPRDVTQGERAAIQNKTAKWDHFYQNRTVYLHSAPVSEADENAQLGETHFTIQTSYPVWQRAEQEMITGLFTR